MEGFNLEGDKLKEECGVFGIYSNEIDEGISHLTYYGLYALQHRGQESCGISVKNGEEIKCYKDTGLVSDVFNKESLQNLKGNISIGHVRYSTAGGGGSINAQPLVSKFKLGSISIAHNGNLVNADVIRELLEETGCTFQTSIDTEVIINLIARSYKKGVERSIVDALKFVKGSYAMLLMAENKLIGARDPNGIRPLCLGKIDEKYVLSSESCALDSIGAEFIRDIEPGEIVIIDEEGVRSVKFAEKTGCATCSFEYIYFARPDSVIDGVNVYESRIKAGEILYKESPVEADVVIGVPDSGIPAAIGYSKASGIPYAMGIIKNKYIGRTFISPTQEMRERDVSVKLNVLKVNVEGKRVIIIDDSIVRGTTSKRLVSILRKAGAKEVHFRVSSPPVKFPCYFGIDTPYREDLIGSCSSLDDIRVRIGADSLEYLSINGLLKSLGKDKGYCLGCFSGEYPLSTPSEDFR
ncbi:amidophosphoribosyltransferase [Clostridium sp. KNHs214]|uniref:amidophosphoribosyltransferase n=1 Tax=Clostridium sp. KNHs214 TaxID=1540257 RepID=UPI00054F4CEE|nr:amidophosphoribosyltransferase [Clostridium sp. KNHs214]